jgi:hypothetical protein
MKFMNYFLKISLASLLAVTIMTPSNAMSAEPGIPQTYFPMMPQVAPGFSLQIDPRPLQINPLQINIDPHTIRLCAMSGLLLLGVYGICKLLGAQSEPRYMSAGLATAAVAAGICCLKYEII